MVNIEVIVAFVLGLIAIVGIDLMKGPAPAWTVSPREITRPKLGQAAVSFGGLSSKPGPDRAYVCEHHQRCDRGALLIACFAPGVALMSIVILVSVALANKWPRGFAVKPKFLSAGPGEGFGAVS